MEPRIYRYIVRYDGGTAPNPFGGWCTLAICKPAIRRTARIGDWIVGFRSRHRGEVIYAMQVAETPSFADYWRDPRFRSRRPDDKSVPTDNIYRPVAEPDGTEVLAWVQNEVHGPSSAPRDLSGQRALVARRFWYFGIDSRQIAPELAHLAPVTQGHVVHCHRRPDDVQQLVAWLSDFRKGLRGQPVDWRGDPISVGRSACGG